MFGFGSLHIITRSLIVLGLALIVGIPFIKDMKDKKTFRFILGEVSFLIVLLTAWQNNLQYVLPWFAIGSANFIFATWRND